MGKISQQDFRNLARAAGRAAERCRSTSTTRPASPSPRLRTRARRLKRQRGIGLVVVDYLQLLQGTGKNAQRQPRAGDFRDLAAA